MRHKVAELETENKIMSIEINSAKRQGEENFSQLQKYREESVAVVNGKHFIPQIRLYRHHCA